MGATGLFAVNRVILADREREKDHVLTFQSFFNFPQPLHHPNTTSNHSRYRDKNRRNDQWKHASEGDGGEHLDSVFERDRQQGSICQRADERHPDVLREVGPFQFGRQAMNPDSKHESEQGNRDQSPPIRYGTKLRIRQKMMTLYPSSDVFIHEMSQRKRQRGKEKKKGRFLYK